MLGAAGRDRDLVRAVIPTGRRPMLANHGASRDTLAIIWTRLRPLPSIGCNQLVAGANDVQPSSDANRPIPGSSCQGCAAVPMWRPSMLWAGRCRFVRLRASSSVRAFPASSSTGSTTSPPALGSKGGGERGWVLGTAAALAPDSTEPPD